MNKINRANVKKPECLENKANEWTKEYIDKRKKNPSFWNWHQYKNEKVTSILAENLSQLTKFHCSYCGVFPLKQNIGGRSIDHFKPKSKFPELAYEWTNLFISCPDCQRNKGASFPYYQLVKPDEEAYEFDYWFEIDWIINKNFVVPNKSRTQKEQEIAQETIDWLGLNNGDRPKERLRELEKYKSSSVKDIWQWSYPFFLERGKN